MNVCLIDVDSKIPNLALMKASTWHKQHGDTVKLWYEPLFDHPDLCYMSKMFEWSDEPDFLPTDADILRGGAGYPDLREVRMPFDVEGQDYDRIMPDYELYREVYPKMDVAIGRFTRGCIRNCPWCVVPKMDGRKVRHVADLDDWWDHQTQVRVLDDNLLADSDLFCKACEQIKSKGKAIKKVIWEALDIRLITDETAAALHSLGGSYTIHFAWDGPAQDDAVPKGIEILRRNGVRPYRLMFYILVGFNTTYEYDMHRIMTLKEMGCHPYVMPFRENGVISPYCHFLSRWCNNKFVFKKCLSFDDYTPWQNYLKKNPGYLEQVKESDGEAR